MEIKSPVVDGSFPAYVKLSYLHIIVMKFRFQYISASAIQDSATVNSLWAC